MILATPIQTIPTIIKDMGNLEQDFVNIMKINGMGIRKANIMIKEMISMRERANTINNLANGSREDYTTELVVLYL